MAAKRTVLESKAKRLVEKRLRRSTAGNTDEATHEPEPMPAEHTIGTKE